MDKIKYLFAILAAFVMGGLFLAGPDEISTEIPYNTELGIGAIAFGCLMIAALYSDRARYLLLVIIFVPFAVVLIIMAASDNFDSGQRILFGLLGAGVSLGAVFCLIGVFAGDDQAMEETDDRTSE